MKSGNALSEFALTFTAGLLFSRRARRAVHGVVMLRRAYEYVLVMAALEGARDDSQALLRGLPGRTGDSGRQGVVGGKVTLMTIDGKESVYGR